MSQELRRPRAPRIFISYHRADSSDFVSSLASDLSHILNDKNAVWYDTLTKADKDWPAEISTQIDSRKVFILIATPGALKAPYVRREIHQAFLEEKQQTSAKKIRIIIHYRECRSKLPKELGYLGPHQWIECTHPKTYRLLLEDILNVINFSLDSKAIEFLYTLDKLNLNNLERPKASADLSDEEREKLINELGKYIFLYMQQERWDDVQICAEEALTIDPHNSIMQNIRQEAIDHLKVIQQNRQNNSTRPISRTISSSSAENRDAPASNTNNSYRRPSPDANVSQSRTKNTQSTYQEANRKRFVQSSRRKNLQPEPRKKTYSLEDISSININNSSQPLILNEKFNFSWLTRESMKNYVTNFTEFMSRFVHHNFLIVLGLVDVFSISIILGIRLQPYFIPIFIVVLFLAFILSPTIKNPIVTTLSITILIASWTLTGFLLGSSFGTWVNQFINSFRIIYSQQPIKLEDAVFALILGTVFAIFSLIIHIILVFNSDYLNERINSKRKHSRHRK